MTEEATTPTETVIDPVAWRDSLPDALKDAPYFKQPDDGSSRTVDQIVADLTNAAKLQGNMAETHLKIPSPDSDAETLAKFKARVLELDNTLTVKPDDFSPVPDEYVAPEGFEGDFDSIKALAKDAKWTQAQLDTFIAKADAEKVAGQAKQSEWTLEQSKILDEKLGAAKADHLARTAAMLMEGNPELATSMMDGSMPANIVLAFDAMATKMLEMGGEAGQFNQQAGAEARAMTPDEALAKCDELRGDIMSMNSGTPAHERAVAKLLEYQQLAMAGR